MNNYTGIPGDGTRLYRVETDRGAYLVAADRVARAKGLVYFVEPTRWQSFTATWLPDADIGGHGEFVFRYSGGTLRAQLFPLEQRSTPPTWTPWWVREWVCAHTHECACRACAPRSRVWWDYVCGRYLAHTTIAPGTEDEYTAYGVAPGEFVARQAIPNTAGKESPHLEYRRFYEV